MSLKATDNSLMTREEILLVQDQLKSLGFNPGPVDGIMGPRTESAIIAFKRSRGLKPRVWVGPQTWQMLYEPELPLTTELPWMAEAKKAMNRHEVYDNKWLRSWLSSDDHALGDPAKFPWCGDFVETAIRLALRDEPVPVNPYWALNWREFGIRTLPTYGAVASIKRPEGGHVCFIMGEDATRYYCAGGNQSNKSCVVPIDKSRFTPESFRWPATFPTRAITMPRMTSSDASSRNEA